MLSALAVAAAITALIAGLAGAWSPCGFSMVDTIGSALGDPRRSATLLACATFTAGAIAGGALTFGGLATAGSLIPDGGGLRELLGAAVALAAAIADWRGMRVAPQIRRQVPERWRWTLPLPLACALYGLLLGIGFTTFVLAFAVWALAGLSVAAGSPAVGLLVGVGFGAGRALPVVWMAPRMGKPEGAQRLEEIATEPRLWLGLRRLDAIGLGLCACLLSAATAAAAVPAASDPSTAGEDLAWQPLTGPGMLRLGSGQMSALPGTHPALGPSTIAWASPGQITIAARSSMAVETAVPAANANALAVSDAWLVYRDQGQGVGESLLAVALGPGAPQAVPIVSAPGGQLGRPSLDGSTVVYSRNSPHGSTIESRNLITGGRRALRSSSSRFALVNPSLLQGRLLYERIDRCSQELRIGSASSPRHDRVLLRLPSTALRDPGYQPGYEHAYNEASLCPKHTAARGRLGSTALGTGVAYVTEIASDPFDAQILAISR
jgi:hypothetical protein